MSSRPLSPKPSGSPETNVRRQLSLNTSRPTSPTFKSYTRPLSPTSLSTPLSPPPVPMSFSQFLERKDEVQGAALDVKQIQALDQLMAIIKTMSVYKEVTLPSEDFVVRFLFARKFDLQRAATLFEKYYTRFGSRGRVVAEDVVDLYKTQVLYLPGTRDRDQAELLVFNARMHLPSTSFFLYMDLFFYLMDIALQSRLTQQKGISFIINMKGASWRMFDAIMLNRFLTQIQDHFPARLNKVYIVDAPYWSTILTSGLKPMMKAKLSNKSKHIDREVLHHYVAIANLPEELGGSLNFDVNLWIEKRRQLDLHQKARGAHEGFLVFRGLAEETWRRRWVVLLDTQISIFKSTEDSVPLKVIDLNKCTDVQESNVDAKLHGIELVCNPQSIYFHAEAQSSFLSWFGILKSLIKRLNEEAARIQQEKLQEELQEQQRLEQEKAREEEELKRGLLMAEQQRKEMEARKKEEEERRKAEEERKRLEEQRRREEAEKKRREEEEKRILEEERRRAEEERQQKIHAKRSNIVQELIWTEQSYNETLKMIIEVYLKPLRSALDTNKPIISEVQVRNIFPEIQAILGVNSALLAALEERFASWSRTQLIGDVFLQMNESLRIYIGLVNNYSMAVETIIKAQEENQAFKAFLAECQSKPETRMIGLAEHLLTPIQRIPRYVLLITDLKKNTDASHPDFENITAALDQIKQTADYINEMKRKADSRLRVVEVLEELKGIPDDFELIAPHRTFILEVDVCELEDEASSKEELIDLKTNAIRSSAVLRVRRTLRLYMFSDILIVAKLGQKKSSEQPQNKKPNEVRAIDARYKMREKIPLCRVLALADNTIRETVVKSKFGIARTKSSETSGVSPITPDSNDLGNLCLLQMADRRFVLQMPSAKARDEFLTAFTTINPLSKFVKTT